MSFDVIIAGAGIIGSSIAWRLAQSGLHVALLDAGRMGAEASSAGAGMLAPGGEIDAQSPWHEFALESLRLYPAFVAGLASETGCPIDFQALGAVELALSEDEWQVLQIRGCEQAPLGIPSFPLSAAELKKRVPAVGSPAAGALFYPHDAQVDPRDLMHALRAACRKRGVAIREGIRVTEIRPAHSSVEVVTAQGVLHAAAAVLAAGAWSSQISVPGLDPPRAYPVRGHLIGFRRGANSLGPILRHQHTYLVERAGGFLIAGTSSEHAAFDRGLDPAITADIHARAARILPCLAGLTPDERWLGFRPAVVGDSPVVGRVSDQPLWLAYGHYRNGILLAPVTAQTVARQINANSGTGSSALRGTP